MSAKGHMGCSRLSRRPRGAATIATQEVGGDAEFVDKDAATVVAHGPRVVPAPTGLRA